jgi:hypothetical protein
MREDDLEVLEPEADSDAGVDHKRGPGVPWSEVGRTIVMVVLAILLASIAVSDVLATRVVQRADCRQRASDFRPSSTVFREPYATRVKQACGD